MAKQSASRPPDQVRIKDKLLQQRVDDVVHEVEQELGKGTRGARSIALERLLQKAFDDTDRYAAEFGRLSASVDDLRQEVADLRKQMTGLREDFGLCLRSLLLATGLADKSKAEEWFQRYYETGSMGED